MAENTGGLQLSDEQLTQFVDGVKAVEPYGEDQDPPEGFKGTGSAYIHPVNSTDYIEVSVFNIEADLETGVLAQTKYEVSKTEVERQADGFFVDSKSLTVTATQPEGSKPKPHYTYEFDHLPMLFSSDGKPTASLENPEIELLKEAHELGEAGDAAGRSRLIQEWQSRVNARKELEGQLTDDVTLYLGFMGMLNTVHDALGIQPPDADTE